MGYSITVQFKTPQEKEKMHTFLEKNSFILEELKILEAFSPIHSNVPSDGEDLGYAPKNKKNLIGFHGTGIPRYLWNICAWMSVKSELRDKKGNPFFFYDYEKMLVTFDPNNKKNTLVDSNGMPIENTTGITEKFIEFVSGTKRNKERTKQLFIQLNEAWNKFNFESEPIIAPKNSKP